MGRVSSSTDNSRPRRLYNIGASFLTIVHKACLRIEQLDNPLGFVSRMMAFVATPIVHPIERHWLLMLSFFDDRILAVEDAAVFIFPQSAPLFSALDEVAILVESVPKWLDDIAIMDLPSLILGEWSQEEKDIVVDVKCDEEAAEPEQKMVVLRKRAKGTEDEEDDEIKEVEETCKDIVEEMEKMGIAKKREEMVDPLFELLDAGWGGKREEMVELKDPLLELLDAGWGGKFM